MLSKFTGKGYNVGLLILITIKQLLTLFLGYMMFGKCHGCIVNPWLLMLLLVPRVNNAPLALSKHHVTLETVNNCFIIPITFRSMLIHSFCIKHP